MLSLDAPCTPRLGVGPHSLPRPSSPHSLLALLRLRLQARLPRGLAGAGWATEAAEAVGAERAAGGAGTPLPPPEAPLLPWLTPPAPHLPLGRTLADAAPPQPLT